MNVTREPERERTAFLAVRSRSGSLENKRPLGNCVTPIRGARMKIFKSDKQNSNAQKIANASWAALAASGLLAMLVPQFFEIETFTAFILALLIPLAVIYIPLLWIAWRINKDAWAQEKQEQQAKEDAEDRAIFGKPLRDFEN